MTSDHGLTIAELAELPEVGASILYAGSDGSARVGLACAIDIPDPTRWIEGGELVVTTGAALGTDEGAWTSYVQGVSTSRAVGLLLVVGPSLPLQEVPAGLISIVQAHELPLLVARHRAALTDIMRAINARALESERTDYQESYALQVRLTAIITRGGGVDALLREWADSTGETGVVSDRTGRVIATTPQVSGDPAVLASLARDRHPPLGLTETVRLEGESYGVVPLAGELTIRGFLVTEAHHTQVAQLALPTLTSLLALEFERRWFLGEGERRQRAQNVCRLLGMTTESGARSFLRSLGLGTPSLWGVVVGAATETQAEVVLDDLAVVLATPLLRHRGKTVECLAATDPVRLLRGYGFDGPVGVGTAAEPGRAAVTMRQAAAAMETSRRTGGLISYVDGASHRFLMEVADPEYLAAFSAGVLAPIESSAQGEVLLETLHVWLREGRSLEACAARLGVHRHTVRNRIHRVMQLTGSSLDTTDAQTELWLALKARGMDEGGTS
ncbi:PucR family transcriptional regulator [Nesterenkonia sp. CL21]|uniref:PucR family transcriptional regulator n=1 Tax=Nesterenkonia sp. CL21 TaxID=3064894 RepID=UPI00287A4EA8|nr:PucR family transcriptional regulator [Nesterenkonia sp. CL21]MDS2173899.1 PucR family transcriptional regulator [Nesterenkonia sp. CL21]